MLKYQIALILSITALFFITPLKSNATLGNTAEQNAVVYGEKGHKPKYHYNGTKDVVIYKKENFTITIIYRDNISILEDITYEKAVNDDEARNHISNYILPVKNEKPLFSSGMAFVDGSFKEDMYKNGIKTKIIYNTIGEATEILSSLQVIHKPQPTAELGIGTGEK